MRANLPKHPAGGFALIAALFLLVIAAAVGAVLMRQLQYQSAGAIAPMNAARARHAAEAGLQWASHRIARSNVCIAGTLNLREAALNGIRVVVSCSRTTHGIGPIAKTVYALAAQAQYGVYGQADFAAARQVATLIL
jgi:MSHA biogenesis protein MshP